MLSHKKVPVMAGLFGVFCLFVGVGLFTLLLCVVRKGLTVFVRSIALLGTCFSAVLCEAIAAVCSQPVVVVENLNVEPGKVLCLAARSLTPGLWIDLSEDIMKTQSSLNQEKERR